MFFWYHLQKMNGVTPPGAALFWKAKQFAQNNLSAKKGSCALSSIFRFRCYRISREKRKLGNKQKRAFL